MRKSERASRCGRDTMKKRNHESSSLPSGNMSHTNNGIESAQKDGKKNLKEQGSTDWSMRSNASGPNTKGKEVVERLYPMAGKFPDSNRRELVGESSRGNSSVLRELHEGTKNTFEGSSSLVETKKTSSQSVTVDQEQLDLSLGANILMPSDNTASKMNKQNMPSLVARENTNKQLSLAMRLKKVRKSPISRIERRPEIALEKKFAFQAMENERKQEQHMITNQKKNGSVIWPGLSLGPSDGSFASDLESAAATYPVSLDSAIGTSKQDLMKCSSSGGKISKVDIHRRPWKRSAVHVHIGHFIRSLQVPDSKDKLLQRPNQSNESLTQEELLKLGDEAFKELQKELRLTRGVLTLKSNTVDLEAMMGIHQHNNHHKSRAIPTNGVYGPQKQNFDFLSLSTGGSELDLNNNSLTEVGRRSDPFSKWQVPHFQEPTQQHEELMSAPMSQTQNASWSSIDHTSAPAHQLSHYSSGQSSGTHSTWRAPMKQDEHIKSFWAAVNNNTMMNQNQYPNSQSSPVRPAFPEAQGPKIAPVSEEHRRFIALTSFAPLNTTGLHLPSSVGEESRGRIRSTSSLQLL